MNLTTIGILGGGQLGRMLVQAGQKMGFRMVVLDPDPACPAAEVANAHICAAYTDQAALAEMAATCAFVTTEFENVSAGSMAHLAQQTRVAPQASAVAIAQDRIAEKRFLQACASQTGIPPTPFQVIESIDDLDAPGQHLFPGVLKTARMGYDGKGQLRANHRSELITAWQAMGSVPAVLEARVELAFELSVLVARGADGATAIYPAAENHHQNGILFTSTVPSPHATPAQLAQVQHAAKKIASLLDYCGVLCVEFFVLADGSLLINEMAPRPHNSAHYTQDACDTCQFTQHIRALTGLPLGHVRQHSVAVMLNLLGDVWFQGGERREPPWHQILALPGAHLHLYGKQKARPGRKMGHINFVTATLDEAKANLAQSCALLGLTSPH